MGQRTRRYDNSGRAERARLTRENIRECAGRLYVSAPAAEFTLERVAQEAGTTVQTVLRAFGNKEQLIIEALAAAAAAGTPLRPTPPGDAAAAVAALFQLYETVGDTLISRLADERRRPQLRAALDEGRAGHRAWVRRAFAPQLRLRKGRERVLMLEALSVATDVYVWKLLRRDSALSVADAVAVVTRLVAGLTLEKLHGSNGLAQLVGRR